MLEQVEQLEEEEVIRELPPPMPKEEKSFWISLHLQVRQETFFSPPSGTRASKWLPHFLQTNSYIGIGFYFTRIRNSSPCFPPQRKHLLICDLYDGCRKLPSAPEPRGTSPVGSPHRRSRWDPPPLRGLTGSFLHPIE